MWNRCRLLAGTIENGPLSQNRSLGTDTANAAKMCLKLNAIGIGGVPLTTQSKSKQNTREEDAGRATLELGARCRWSFICKHSWS
jgi:hypothetical protein